MRGVNTVLDTLRSDVRDLMRRVAQVLNDISGGKITPNAITLTGLAGHVLIVWLIVASHPWRAAVLLVIFGLFDTLDGELARLQNRSSAKGMLLDATTDRMKEILIYTALAYAIVNVGRPYMAVWAVAACGASILVSYVKAKGEAIVSSTIKSHENLNHLFADGLMRFEVRMGIVFIGLVSGRVILSVIVITIGAGLTAVFRLVRISSKLA